MSEPDSAFMKFRISRATLVRWLDAPPSRASRWSDWRAISGQWYTDGKTTLAEAAEPVVADIVQDADTEIARFTDNRQFVRRLLNDPNRLGDPGDPDDQLQIAAFDDHGEYFLAGTIEYSQNLIDIIVFLAIARGAADYFDASDHGVAIVHNFIWGGESDEAEVAALRLLPSGESRLLPKTEYRTIVPIFRPIVDALVDRQLPKGFLAYAEPDLLAS